MCGELHLRVVLGAWVGVYAWKRRDPDDAEDSVEDVILARGAGPAWKNG